MSEGRDWYGKDWKTLRSSLIKVCRIHQEELLASIKAGPFNLEKAVDVFSERVIGHASQLGRSDKTGMWENALPLLADRGQLREWLEKDRIALCGGKKTGEGKQIVPGQALGQKLSQFFEAVRRDLVAAGRGVSPSKIKTWERIDRISRELSDGTEEAERCAEWHFEDVARYIKENHANDKNLPRRTATVRSYFHQFSEACADIYAEEDSVLDELSFHNAAHFLNDVSTAVLKQCLDNLTQGQLEGIDACFRLGIIDKQYDTFNAFLKARSLRKKEFEKEKAMIIDKLRDCLENSLQARFGGY